MLVLSRKAGETIRIGDQIEVTVTKISHSRVKIAVAAPEDVRILRKELSEWHELSFGGPLPVDSDTEACCTLAAHK